jgi:hypothetical protein
VFEISNIGTPTPGPGKPRRLVVSYASVSSGAPAITDQEFNYVLQKKASLRERHKQLQTMNESTSKSVISLYALMLLYAGAPFSGLHSLLGTGFFRVWGFGGMWLALTGWFYCDRALWKYGNHLFEQIFCMRQLFQMDKVAIGRSKLHNLYAILPSYGYSWDRLHIEATPSDDPTHLSNRRIQAAAWFFKLVNLFPLMYFVLFVSMVLFARKMMDTTGEDRLETYTRVALGFSFVFFWWLSRSMRSCAELMKAAFRARRVGVESPWPRFPDRTVDEATQELHRRRNRVCIGVATCVSIINLVAFLSWALLQWPAFHLRQPHFLISPIAFAARDKWAWAFGAVSVVIFGIWMWFKECEIRAVLRAAGRLWPSPEEMTKRAGQLGYTPSFFQFLGLRTKFIAKAWWVLSG